jgi:hypothetical protein
MNKQGSVFDKKELTDSDDQAEEERDKIEKEKVQAMLDHQKLKRMNMDDNEVTNLTSKERNLKMRQMANL